MALMLALMMKKMLATLGIAAIGALAAKALGVALLALLIASLIGIKKLAETSQDDGGGGGHHVQYVTAEHHRQKREIDNELPLPYRGWAKHSKI